MKKATVFVVFAALAAVAAPPPKIHGWNTWQRPDDGGKFERIRPSAELPQGAMKFLPDPEKKRYSIQWYRALPVKPADHLRFVFTFRSASDTNPGVTAALTMKARDRQGAWCKHSFGERQTVAVEAGKTQIIEFEVDLRKCDVPEIGFLCPTITLTNLTAGDVTFTAFRIETAKDAPAGKRGPSR